MTIWSIAAVDETIPMSPIFDGETFNCPKLAIGSKVSQMFFTVSIETFLCLSKIDPTVVRYSTDPNCCLIFLNLCSLSISSLISWQSRSRLRIEEYNQNRLLVSDHLDSSIWRRPTFFSQTKWSANRNKEEDILELVTIILRIGSEIDKLDIDEYIKSTLRPNRSTKLASEKRKKQNRLVQSNHPSLFLVNNLHAYESLLIFWHSANILQTNLNNWSYIFWRNLLNFPLPWDEQLFPC